MKNGWQKKKLGDVCAFDKVHGIDIVAAGALVILALAPLSPVLGPLHVPTVGLMVFGALALSLLVMALLEQIYRNANPAGRFALKFLVFGVGSLFAYDLFLYSQALLLKGIEPASWVARGFFAALVVPMIALAARRNPQRSLNVFVSRQVVFYTTSFLVIGAYLLIMAAGGYLIVLYGGTWGRVAQLVFFAGAGVVLLVLMSSAADLSADLEAYGRTGARGSPPLRRLRVVALDDPFATARRRERPRSSLRRRS